MAQGWRGRLRRSDDLAELAGAATGAPAPGLPADLRAAASERALARDGAALRAAEEAREHERLAALARWRALLVDGPVLELPLGPDMSYGFDPSEVLALEGLGSIYPGFALGDAWGELQAHGGGALLADDRARATDLRLVRD